MPQMSPLMWGTLFIFFSILLMMTIVKMYFTYFNELTQTNKPNLCSSYNYSWMW